MTWASRGAALALGVLASIGTIVWADVVDRYVDASELRLVLPGHVRFADIAIPPIASSDENVTVGVLAEVQNPTDIGIIVLSISYRFYMDNVSDTRPFEEKDKGIFVGLGGYFAEGSEGLVQPHSTARFWANITVRGSIQPTARERLNTTFNGRYYPIIDGNMEYRIAGTAVSDRVAGLFVAPAEGVEPRAA